MAMVHGVAKRPDTTEQITTFHFSTFLASVVSHLHFLLYAMLGCFWSVFCLFSEN